ncbi:MAG: hypothetical protein ABF743_10910 [Schleiferilactobacillus perolens]|uniref:hypothetical protein n=1 Tax=Schleiferilactobacillus perolens TaxID=100468 RepID=UPI0039E986E9
MADLDLTDRLVDELQSVAPVASGYSDADNSIGLYPTAGSRTIASFMNGTRDDGMHYNVSIVAASPEEAEQVLNSIAENLRILPNNGIKSSNGTFIYLKTVIIVPPFISRMVTESKMEYTMTLEVEILR